MCGAATFLLSLYYQHTTRVSSLANNDSLLEVSTTILDNINRSKQWFQLVTQVELPSFIASLLRERRSRFALIGLNALTIPTIVSVFCVLVAFEGFMILISSRSIVLRVSRRPLWPQVEDTLSL
jgi:hypothetical protein